MKNEKIKSNILIILFSFIVCFILVGTSPLYDFYYFLHDASVYYVMGRGMKEGLIPYVDLFDHKGLYIYFLNMIGSLIEYKHIGMYIISSIFTGFFGIYIKKILDLYNKNTIVNIFIAFFMIIISRFDYFSNNTQNPEQYIITFEIISIYLFAKYVLNNRYDLENDTVKLQQNNIFYYGFFEGIFCGIVFFMKFNYVLIWIVLYFLSIYFIDKKNIFKMTIGAFSGFVIAILPVVIYCIFTNSFNDMIEAYFILNIKYASHGFAKYQNLSKIDLLVRTFVKYRVIMIISFLVSVINIKFLLKYKKEMLSYILLFISSIIIMIAPLTGLNYYSIIMIIFFIPTLYFVLKKVFIKNNIVKIFLLSILILVCGYIFSYKNMVTEITKKDNKESKEMSKIITNVKKRNKKASVLFVGYCTYVYNEANIIPSSKYFYIPIVKYEDKPEIFETIRSEVLSNKHNIIALCYDQEFIINIFGDELYNHLNNKYELIASYGNKYIFKRKW